MTHDTLAIAPNNVLDGREYEEHLGFVYPNALREGDIITDGVGTYQVEGVGTWPTSTTPDYVQHIRIKHTLAGPIMGGLLRGQLERIHILARRRTQ